MPRLLRRFYILMGILVWLGVGALSVSAQERSGDLSKTARIGETNAIQFISVDSGLCAEVDGAVSAGQNVEQQPCVGFRTPQQNWAIDENVANMQISPYQGPNDLSGQCLEVAGGAAADGANVQIADCSGALFQQWTFEWVGNGHQIKVAHSGKCLEMTGGEGGNLQQATCSTAASQVWSLTPPNASYFVFPQHTVATPPQRFLELVGTNIQQGENTATATKMWFFTPSNDGLQLQNIQTLQCGEVAGFSTNNGGDANVQDAACTGGTNQEWRLQPVPVGLGQGTPVPFQVIARHSSKCMDVAGGFVTTVGTNVQQWECIGASQLNQLWNTQLWNTFPFADDDAFTISQQATSLAVLDNDGDPDPVDTPTIVSVTQGANGQVQIAGDNLSVTYTANSGFVGTDEFTYTITDGNFAGAGTATATVMVTVQGGSAAQLINGIDGTPITFFLSNQVGQQLNQALAFQEATPLGQAIPAGNVTVEARDQTSGSVLATANLSIDSDKSYVIVAGGTASNAAIMMTEARQQAGAGEIRTTFFNAVADSPANGLDFNLLDTSNPPQIEGSLVENLGFGAAPSPYVGLPERNLNIQVATNPEEGVFRFLLNGLAGETFAAVATGSLNAGTLALFFYNKSGEKSGDNVVAAEEEAGIPKVFVLRGNYPNPFNPATTIQYDLPEPAEVHLEVIDLLGRSVLTTPVQQVAAGASLALEVDAADLASGIYIYRVVAQTATATLVRTGRMTLIK